MDQRTDAELIKAVQDGNKNAFNEIVDRYEPLIVSIVEKFLSNESFGKSDRDDLTQEAAIALYNATMSFDLLQSEVTFGLYARICLSNSLNSVLRKRIRQIRADKIQQDDSDAAAEVGFDERSTDARLLLDRVEILLSKFEIEVFRLFIRGCSHKSIALTLNRTEKAVDNAIYRIRCKIAKLL